MSGGSSLATAPIRLIVLGVALGAVFFWCEPAAAVVLLDDTWADGSRAETNLPSESATWVGIPSGGGTVNVTSGALSMTQGTSSQKMWTYFASDGNPVQLQVGDKLRATIAVIPKVQLYNVNSRNFRFGLFHDPTNGQVALDVNSDGGGDGNPWADARGYGVLTFLTSGPTTASAFQIGKRTAVDGSQTSLLGSGGAYTFPSPQSGGASVTHQLGTLYTYELELNYVSATQMDVTSRIFNSSGLMAQHSVSDNGATLGSTAPYTKFDQLFFRFSSASGTADELEFRRLKIELESPNGSLQGDFNSDGNVDASDYVVWRKTGGASEQYTLWRTNFGRTSGGSATAAVPEPAAGVLAIFAVAVAAMQFRTGPSRFSK